HRIDCVSEHDDPRAQRNVRSFQTVGVASAIPVFVVMSYEGHDVPQLGHGSRKFSALDRVRAHDNLFFGCEATGLTQYGPKYFVNLSDIVKQSGGNYSLD